MQPKSFERGPELIHIFKHSMLQYSAKNFVLSAPDCMAYPLGAELTYGRSVTMLPTCDRDPL